MGRVSDLNGVTESGLLAFKRYALDSIELRRGQLEDVVGKGDMHRAVVIQGSLEELRHLVATIESELRARAKEKS